MLDVTGIRDDGREDGAASSGEHDRSVVLGLGKLAVLGIGVLLVLAAAVTLYDLVTSLLQGTLGSSAGAA